MADRYEQRGVSAGKEEVHQAVANLGKGLFPQAFCRIYPDVLGNDPEMVNALSADGCGTKSILAYLWWKETGDTSVWQGIAQDALVMNTDDLICAGATGPFIFTSVINRNKHKIPGEVLAALINGSIAFCDLMQSHGIQLTYAGGETADLGDLVRTLTVDVAMTTRFRKNQVINAGNIQPGLVVVGLSAYGKCSYEQEYNSGISSNGLTSARHDLLAGYYGDQYPETLDPQTDRALSYCGNHRLEDELPGTSLSVGKALLSPTRTFLPVLHTALRELGPEIKGIINCTGGGQSKVLHYVEGVKIVKDRLLPVAPLFRMIQSETGTSWKEMFKVFNGGTRLEVYLPVDKANAMIDIARSYGIEAQTIGFVESATETGVDVHHEGEIIRYLKN